MNFFTNFLNPNLIEAYAAYTLSVVVFFAIFFAVFFVLFLFPLMIFNYCALYLIQSFFMYLLAGKKGAEHPWYAFIPFLRTYLQLSLPEGNSDFLIKFGDRKKLALYLTLTEIVVDLFPVKGLFSSLAFIVLEILFVKRVYDFISIFDKENSLLFTILSAICSPLYTAFLWVEYIAYKEKEKENGQS